MSTKQTITKMGHQSKYRGGGYVRSGNTKGRSITVPLTSCLTGLVIKTKIVSSHAAESQLVKREVNGTVIRPPLVLPG